MSRSKRGSPIACPPGMYKEDKHESKLNEMHSALHALGDKIRKPFARSGEKLLPKNLREHEAPEAAEARKHIDHLHKRMRGGK